MKRKSLIMKLAGSGSCLIAAALLLPVGAWSEEATASASPDPSPRSSASSAVADTPYATIVARNMFGLLPIPPPDPNANKPPVDPPPKITPNGIMTIFGKEQALFKVANKPKPGQPAKEDAYVLAEGEREDDITVLKINHVDGIITFDNHGTVQELALVPAKDSGPSGGPGGGPGARPEPGNRGAAFGRPNGFGQQSGVGGRSFPGRFPGGNPGVGMNNNNNINNNLGNPNAPMGIGGGGVASVGNGGITMLGGTPVNANRVYQPVDDSTITPEQSVILIEAQRMKALQSGNSQMAGILPTTPLTQQNLQENGPGAGDVPQ